MRARRRGARRVRHRGRPDPAGAVRPGGGAGGEPPPRSCATSWASPRSPAPGCSRPPCPARGTAGSPCCATTAPCRSPTCSARPSATPADGFPLVAAGADDDRRRRAALPRALAELGGHVAARRPGAHRDAPAARPRRDLAQAARARPSAPPARRRSTPPAPPGTAGSSPRRSRSSWPRRCATPPAATTRACSPPTTSRAGRARYEDALVVDGGRGLGGGQARARGRRVRCSRRPSSCCGTPT